MSARRCMYLLTYLYILSVYGALGHNTDVTDHVTTDTRTVLLAVSDLTRQIEELKKDRLDDHQKILSLESKCEKLSEENARLNKRVEHLESLPRHEDNQHTSPVSHSPLVSAQEQNNGINTDVHSGQGNEGSARRIVQSSGRRIRSERLQPGASLPVAASTGVAFSAYLSQDTNVQGIGNVFKFDNVITNVGNAYNPTTGVFTCPVSGTYVFMWSLEIFNTGFAHALLVKNGVNVGWDYTGDDHYPSMMTQASVLVLSAGDVITVQLGPHSFSTQLRERNTSFNGFMIS
ncbi:complement C1q tumor necrosis factor-related protein 3-like [Argopecten irradians]|uniref:complement C1q tumor necrosis factor-related protein 3-like n=1 Tax=Argopecten irradians TaxID=31199 RepID=UPI00371C8B43